MNRKETNVILQPGTIKRIRNVVVIAGAIILFAVTSCKKSNAKKAPEPPVKEVDIKLGNGVNLQPSYANNGNVNFGWDLMKQYSKIKTVRIEIEPDKISQGQNWIKQALNNGYSVIATYHKSAVLGSDNSAELLAAANWWKANYKYLSANGEFIINLMNEWGSHDITPEKYAQDYNNAISVIRTVYDGKIIIDCPGYGQETATVSLAVKGVNGVKITDENIILSAHVYRNGYNKRKNRNLTAADLDDLSSTGKACIIGEFGNQPEDGNVDWAGIVNYAKTKNWPVLGWCWNGDGGTMNMVSPTWYQNANPAEITINADYFNTIYNLL